ncbi:hypothetical protein B0F90DRAFT_1800932, partial [Multifurca ochricompacta]
LVSVLTMASLTTFPHILLECPLYAACCADLQFLPCNALDPLAHPFHLQAFRQGLAHICPGHVGLHWALFFGMTS